MKLKKKLRKANQRRSKNPGINIENQTNNHLKVSLSKKVEYFHSTAWFKNDGPRRWIRDVDVFDHWQKLQFWI